jgi:hypothetical protein
MSDTEILRIMAERGIFEETNGYWKLFNYRKRIFDQKTGKSISAKPHKQLTMKEL